LPVTWKAYPATAAEPAQCPGPSLGGNGVVWFVYNPIQDVGEEKMKVLVVDDFATMRKIIRNVLKQINLDNVLEAESGKHALNVLKTEEVDLIISDWIMPEMTGIEFLKACKEDDNLKKIPFIMVTAEAQKANILEAIKSGVDNYIVKPFTPDKLKEAIDKACARIAKQ
jgi:two-component system chemotaxis response regulator CheY